jgi:hypothetical protein
MARQDADEQFVPRCDRPESPGAANSIAPTDEKASSFKALSMLNENSIRELLSRVARRECEVDSAVAALRSLPYEDLGFARIDHHRALRRGCPEVIYCAHKTPEQVADIAICLVKQHPLLLATRADEQHHEAVRSVIPEIRYDPTARLLWLDQEPDRIRKTGVVLIAAGTSDLPVAEEAARTLDLLGYPPQRIYDVGVAGLHRLLGSLSELRAAKTIIVVAGMDGALPGVVAGLVSVPVIAVPTSVGYGASFGGIAALLTMLNSCSTGVGVVNIDNGFGAASLAASIMNTAQRDHEQEHA